MGSREWAEQHIGVDIEMRDQRWTFVSIEQGACILENEEESRRVRMPPTQLQRKWVHQNQPEDSTTS